MESQAGDAQAGPLVEKQMPVPGQVTTAPTPGVNLPPGGQVYQAPPQYAPQNPAGHAPPAYTAVPQVQYIIQNPTPMANPPKDYFMHAILVTIFCFWPTGIIAIIKALDSRRAAEMGDGRSAELSSKAARKLSLISLFVGIAIMAIVTIIIVIELLVIFLV